MMERTVALTSSCHPHPCGLTELRVERALAIHCSRGECLISIVISTSEPLL